MRTFLMNHCPKAGTLCDMCKVVYLCYNCHTNNMDWDMNPRRFDVPAGNMGHHYYVGGPGGLTQLVIHPPTPESCAWMEKFDMCLVRCAQI